MAQSLNPQSEFRNLKSSNTPVAGSESREQLGPRFRRRLGASGGPLLWHSPAARGGKLEAREHSTRRPLSEERRSSRFKLARPYVPRAESARSARAALLQAAAELFNNPRAAHALANNLYF